MASTPPKLFGTDGIRGEANAGVMTVENALQIGRALGYLAVSRHEHARILIGKDTRRSGYLFENALVAGLCSVGAEPYLVGPLPTPGIAFMTLGQRADAGVVISASHNPFHDNGIKVFGSNGFKLADEMERQIEALVHDPRPLHNALARGANVGRAHRIDEAWGRYVVKLKFSFPADLTLDGLKIAVDCAHGAAYKVAPAVFEELGAEVVALGCQPNGLNINDGCGALHPAALAQAVVAHGCHVGVALDGDADRLILVDEKGAILDGDQLLALCATRMLAAGTLNRATLVVTVMSNYGLELAMRDRGVRLVRTDVGDRHVVEAMRTGGFNLGGEQSGHLVFLDHATTGDGVLAALQVLAIAVREGRPVSELVQVMKRVPQVLHSVKVREKPPISSLQPVQAAIEHAERELAGRGRVLVRYSGTENKCRVMVEGVDAAPVEAHASWITEAVLGAIGL
ncbi:MAG: phosphoglucosamine mutase [Myxococcales bacterium]|nr:phosphoglucosamine mutase [Myxococcales bacterium]